MRKRIIKQVEQEATAIDQDWLKLEELVEVEITSEDAAYPIESALLPAGTTGWRAKDSGKQTIRLLFTNPQRLRHIRLNFEETDVERTQEYILRWSPDGGQSFQEIVRQQWNFNPQDTTVETEDYQLDLEGVTVLELSIIPDISGGKALASLQQLRLA